MQDWPLQPFETALKPGTGPLSVVPHDPPYFHIYLEPLITFVSFFTLLLTEK